MTAVISPTSSGDYFAGLDSSDPEYVKQLLRPAAIKEDVKIMEQRRRVSLILRSPEFRKELEKISASQMRNGELSPNVLALKQLIDIFTPHTKLGSSTFSKSATVPVVPINDLRSQKSPFSKPEKIMRCKLASTFRLVDIFDWSTCASSHISARVFKEGDTFLFNPRGLLFNEITASSLVKVDSKGNILDAGSTALGIDRQSWMLHSAVHDALPTVRCIIQLSTPATIAVSCLKSGLLPISQEAMLLGKIAAYDPGLQSYTPVVVGEEGTSESPATRRRTRASEEVAAIRACLSGEPRLLLIKKYGILALGRSVEEAWMMAYLITTACESQLRLACLGANELVLPPIEPSLGAAEQTQELLGGHKSAIGGFGDSWRPGELEFEAMMRRLDSAGYRTGHIYRIGQVRRPQPASLPTGTERVDGPGVTEHVQRAASLGRRLREDVEVPPSVTSFAANYYTDASTRAKLSAEHRLKTMSLQRMHWRNTPNAYQRDDIEEVGTANPKKIAHWIEGGKKTTGGFAMATEDPNQFAPQGDDPQELRMNLKKVRSNYYKDVRNAGPQSKILEGLDLDGVDFTSSTISPPMSPRGGTLVRCLDPTNPPILEPGHVVVVGAVSKGIIHRDQQHNVGLFQSVFSPNPFDLVTDDELDRYRRNIDRKTKGLPTEEEEEAVLEQQRRAVILHTDEISRSAADRSCLKQNQLSFWREIQRHVSQEASTLADLPSSLLVSSVWCGVAASMTASSSSSSSSSLSVYVSATGEPQMPSIINDLVSATPLLSAGTSSNLTPLLATGMLTDPPHRQSHSPCFASVRAGDDISQCTSRLQSHGSVLRQSLGVEPEGIRSDTSVGEFSGTDAGKAVDASDSKGRQKKRRFKMPSFARRGKDKKKETSKS